MKDKKNNILLALLILEAVGIFVIEVLFPTKMVIISPFGLEFTFFVFSIGLFFVISLYVLTTYFLATHEKYILIFFIVGIIMLILNLPLFSIASAGFSPSTLLYFSSNLIMYSVFPTSLMLLILKNLKIFEKQNALIKTIIITAMIFPLILFTFYSDIFIYTFVLSKI